MSHANDGPGVTAPLPTSIVPLTGMWNLPPPSIALNPGKTIPDSSACVWPVQKLPCVQTLVE